MTFRKNTGKERDTDRDKKKTKTRRESDQRESKIQRTMQSKENKKILCMTDVLRYGPAEVNPKRLLAAKIWGYALYFNRTFAYETYYYGIYFYEIYFYGSILL
jgi:hypothetical protein